VTPEVETQQGRIEGQDLAGLYAFRGVPFAAAPTGLRRFRPPQPPEPWSGVLDARRPGAAAPQAALPVFGILNAAGTRLDEDCLSLNVWTPGTDEARRPVLVWIHGGGFLIGSGATPLYDGADLARRGNMVIVTVNYRLGALGFLHLNGLLGSEFADASNAGLRDQIAALEWVRDNIERFGGDPENVTVSGQSAGAMSVGALIGAPSARPLFGRAILQSGAAEHVLSQEDADEVARTFLRELGGPPPSPDAFARIPVADILAAQGRTMAQLSDLKRLMVFMPLVDGELIPLPPLEAIRRGDAAHIQILAGTTLDEWKLFRVIDGGLRFGEQSLAERFESVLGAPARQLSKAIEQYREAVRARGGRTTAFEIWSAFQSARIFHVPAARLAETQRAAGGSAHNYLFTWRAPAMRRVLGACHAIDVPFVFGRTDHPIARPLFGFTRSARTLSRKVQHAWANFARSGNPAYDHIPDWQPYGVARETMVLGRRCELALAPLEEEWALVEGWQV
jgi:para-nitrobenzyl esterase